MKISIFIPCIPKHLIHIPAICSVYVHGAMRPHEIVCVLSDSKNASQDQIDAARRWCKLVEREEKIEAGPCRQLAAEYTSGDIISYNDADDMPTLDRLEYVAKVMENKEILLVSHLYWFSTDEVFSDKYLPLGIVMPWQINEIYDRVGHQNRPYGHDVSKILGLGPVHAGVPSIRRELLESVKWKSEAELPEWAPAPRCKSEDAVFCFESWLKYRKNAIINRRLYVYSV